MVTIKQECGENNDYTPKERVSFITYSYNVLLYILQLVCVK